SDEYSLGVLDDTFGTSAFAEDARQYRFSRFGIRNDRACAEHALRWDKRMDTRIHTRGGSGTGTERRPSELRVSWANRHRLDTQRNWAYGRTNGEIAHPSNSLSAARHA